MKFLFALLVIFPLTLSANESIICISNTLQLDIVVSNDTNTKSVSWIIKLLDNVDVAISGSGLWQKEVDTDDAFSSFDEVSAVSYKDKRAVFAMDADQAIYFPYCSIRTGL